MRATAESVRLEMIDIVRMAAEPRQPGDSIKTMIARSGIRLGLNATRVKKLWYGEVATVPAHEADQLRSAKRHIMRAQQASLAAKLNSLETELAGWE